MHDEQAPAGAAEPEFAAPTVAVGAARCHTRALFGAGLGFALLALGSALLMGPAGCRGLGCSLAVYGRCIGGIFPRGFQRRIACAALAQ